MAASTYQPEYDQALWNSYRSGDESAFRLIYQQHYGALYRYAFKICGHKELTKDCIQDMFATLWLKRNKVNEVSHIRAYLLKYLRRELLREMGRGQRFSELEGTAVEEQEIEFSYEALLVLEQTQQAHNDRLQMALKYLTKRQREIIYLRFYNDLSYEQIAEVMKISYQSTRNLIHEAVKVLRDQFTLAFSIGLVLLLMVFVGK